MDKGGIDTTHKIDKMNNISIIQKMNAEIEATIILMVLIIECILSRLEAKSI